MSSSLPQGDGLAPLALNVMLSAPCRHVASSFGSSLRQSVFLDDRAFTVEPRAVARVLSVWGSWSLASGLKENESKRAVVCSRPRTADSIRQQGLGSWLKQHARILGVDFTVSSETGRPSSAARFQEAMRIGKRLLTKGIALDIRRDLWRTRVLPLATWGHLFDPPRLEDIKELEKLGASVKYWHRAASVHLRRLLEGHNMDMHFQAGMHACRTLLASGSWEEVARTQGPGTWFGTVSGFLRDMGWHGESNTVFTTEHARIDFATGRLSNIAHCIRAQWRDMLLRRFRESGRRDSSQLQGWLPSANRTCLAIRMYQEAPAEGKAVISGAACSTAFYDMRRTGGVDPTCRWCLTPTVADWDHLVWNCPAMLGCDQRPPCPLDPATRRLGWPEVGDSQVRAAARLRWMASVREQVREYLG